MTQSAFAVIIVVIIAFILMWIIYNNTVNRRDEIEIEGFNWALRNQNRQ